MLLRALPEKSKLASVPEALDRHLSAVLREDIVSTARYIERGAELVSPEAMAALRRLMPALHAKLDTIQDSAHLRRRIEILAQFFNEASLDGQTGTPAHRDCAFALLYFVKGFDRIPDTVPEIGFLDDAMIVQLVLQRHASVLRTHWLRRGRLWPIDL
jgi:uncharacterized membrane protein YkvA (DUF1232 family)